MCIHNLYWLQSSSMEKKFQRTFFVFILLRLMLSGYFFLLLHIGFIVFEHTILRHPFVPTVHNGIRKLVHEIQFFRYNFYINVKIIINLLTFYSSQHSGWNIWPACLWLPHFSGLLLHISRDHGSIEHAHLYPINRKNNIEI